MSDFSFEHDQENPAKGWLIRYIPSNTEKWCPDEEYAFLFIRENGGTTDDCRSFSAYAIGVSATARIFDPLFGDKLH